MKIYAIGDLHGHFDQWLRLYRQLQASGLDDQKDQLVFLGDVVDGGNQTRQMVQWLIKYKKKYPQTVCLYGNHEDLMLDALDYGGVIYGSYDLWYKQGGKETYESYIPKNIDSYSRAIMQVKDTISKSHRKWLKRLPLYYDTDKYFFVHAGINPKMTLEEFKQNLDFGDKDTIRDALWIRDEFIFSQADWGKKIIFGHTTTHYPIIMRNKIGIDGMFLNRGNLLALELPSEKIYSEKSD